MHTRRRLAISVALLAAGTTTVYADDLQPTADVAPVEDTAQAQDGPPELIQVYDSTDLGELKLPGLWAVTDVEDGVRAVEPDNPRPLAIEIGTQPLPEKVPAAILARAVLAELQAAAAGVAPTVDVDEPIATDDRTERHYIEIAVTENSADMRYAILIVTSRKRALVASLAAPAERFDAVLPRKLLQDIVASIDERR